MVKLFPLIVFFVFGTACDDDPDRFEDLDKLRALGVSADKSVVMPSTDSETQTINLDVYATVPLGDEVSAAIFEDEKSLFATNASGLAFVEGSESYTDHNRFRLYTIKATFDIPTDSELVFDEKQAIRIRYGFLLTSNSEEEKIVGDVVVRPEGAEELGFVAPQIEITEPISGATVAKNTEIDIKANVVNSNDEGIKIGWFVSGGEVENRRSRDTKWKTDDNDKQTLIATVRGKRSRGFAIQVIDLAAE